MNVEHYTPFHFSKRSLQSSQFFSSHFEPFLLSLLILTGIIGSIYLFGQKLVSPEPVSTASAPQNNGASIASLLLGNDEEAPANDFDDFIKMSGSPQAGVLYNFEFLKDVKSSRFVLEMGDGVRLIITQNSLSYSYAQPGKYVIELKEIKNGLLHLVGTKKIKVK